MANQDRTQLQATIAANLKDNTTGYITPARLRQIQNNITDSVIYSAAAETQQIPLFVAGDGFVKAEVKQATPAWVYGSLSITANTLAKPTKPKCSFLYVQAGGYIWGLQFDEAPEIPNGYTGVIAPETKFERIVDIETYEALAGHITLDETIYGDYEAVQNTLPIGIEIQLTINKFNEGTDAGPGDITPLLTLDSDGLINFNYHRVQGVDAGILPTDAVNFSQHLEIIYGYYLLYNQPTILSTPENPPFSLTSVIIHNKPGNITAEVGDAVQFKLPNTGEEFSGEIAEIVGDDLVCSWIGYTGLPVDDAGNWKIIVVVDGVEYPSEEVTIATEYVPQFDGNGLNQEGYLGNYLVVDKVAQMSFVLNSIMRLGTKVISQIVNPSDAMQCIVKVNRELINTEGLAANVWACYDKNTGDQVNPTDISGSGASYTLTFAVTADSVAITFLGENLPFILP